MRKLLFIVSCLLFFSLAMQGTSSAIDFGTGAKLPEGFYLNLYPYWYAADRLTNKDGDAAIDNLGLDKYGMYLSGSYYTEHFLLNAVVPVADLKISALQGRDEGLGDCYLRAGYFLSFGGVTILPALVVKLPTGHFDKNDAVNVGDGQADVNAELYFFKVMDKFSVDWLFKYSVRQTNHHTDFNPGDEFDTEGLITYGITDKIKVGPSGVFVMGGDNKRNGLTISNSGIRKLSLGGELYYKASPRLKIAVAMLKDVDTRNTTEGTLVLSRITIPF